MSAHCFVVARSPRTDHGARANRISHLFAENWQSRYKAKDQELEELKAEMKRAGEIMTVIGRLLSDGEVRSLAEIKKKVSPKIQAAIKVATRYVRDTLWAKRKILPSGYSMYSE